MKRTQREAKRAEAREAREARSEERVQGRARKAQAEASAKRREEEREARRSEQEALTEKRSAKREERSATRRAERNGKQTDTEVHKSQRTREVARATNGNRRQQESAGVNAGYLRLACGSKSTNYQGACKRGALSGAKKKFKQMKRRKEIE